MKLSDLKPRVVRLLEPWHAPEPPRPPRSKQTPEQRREVMRRASANWKKRQREARNAHTEAHGVSAPSGEQENVS